MTTPTDNAGPSFRHAYARAYRGGTAAMLALPALALIPAAVEMAQHVVEISLGMYNSPAAAAATDEHPFRLWSGLLKVLSLHLPAYWVTRHMATGDRGYAGAADRRAMRRFAAPVAFSMTLAAAQLFVLPRSGGWLVATLLLGPAVAALTAAWFAGAALGQPGPGPAGSARLMLPRLAWSTAYLLAVVFLPLALHTGLGVAGVLAPKMLLWPIMVADSLLVAWLASVMAASNWVAAARAAARAGEPLAPFDHAIGGRAMMA